MLHFEFKSLNLRQISEKQKKMKKGGKQEWKRAF